MSITYDEDGADILIEGKTCPTCSGNNTLYDPTFGFWKCEDYSSLWGAMKCNVCESRWAQC
jgi:hypothetical protein